MFSFIIGAIVATAVFAFNPEFAFKLNEYIANLKK
jgi:hypothetical protein